MCIEHLYREYQPAIRHFLVRNSGNVQDVEDLLQDAIVVLYKRLAAGPLTLDCTLKTYFMSVCRNLWLQRLERKYRLIYVSDMEVNERAGTYSMDESLVDEATLEQQRLFHKHLMKMPADCRNILQLYCLKISYREIARLMNYKDEVYVKTRKYSCKQMLRRRIQRDPEYQQFLKYHEQHDNGQLDRSLQRK